MKANIAQRIALSHHFQSASRTNSFRLPAQPTRDTYMEQPGANNFLDAPISANQVPTSIAHKAAGLADSGTGRTYTEELKTLHCKRCFVQNIDPQPWDLMYI